MYNQRGSAMLNVIAVVVMLLILGLGLMQVVNADATIARRDSDVACAFQMAEGGIDFGMEVLVAGPAAVLGEGFTSWPKIGVDEAIPFLIELEEGEVTVTVEEVEGDKFLITSRAVRGSTARTIEAEVVYFETGDPFPYSLFIGSQGNSTEEYDLVLENLTILGSVYITASKVYIRNVKFMGDVHFDSDEVTITKNTTFNFYRPDPKATKEERTRIFPPDGTHWSNLIVTEAKGEQTPDISIVEYGGMEEFEQWDPLVTEVRLSQLEALNYFPGDITILVDKFDYPRNHKTVVTSGTGSVTFGGSTAQYEPDRDVVLIVMAANDIVGVEKLTNKGNGNIVDLYLYAKGSILTSQNIYVSSAMAKIVSLHNGNYTIQKPDPLVFEDLPDRLRIDWRIHGFYISKWMN